MFLSFTHKSEKQTSSLTHSQTIYGSLVDTYEPYSRHYMSALLSYLYYISKSFI